MAVNAQAASAAQASAVVCRLQAKSVAKEYSMAAWYVLLGLTVAAKAAIMAPAGVVEGDQRCSA